MAAKRGWDYPDAWIEAWREQLTLSTRDLEDWIVFVVRGQGSVLGFAAVDPHTEPPELEHLWVRPDAIGTGIGTRLFHAVVTAVRERGASRLATDSDPNAIGFYHKMGGIETGETPASVLGTSRVLPRVEFDLDIAGTD